MDNLRDHGIGGGKSEFGIMEIAEKQAKNQLVRSISNNYAPLCVQKFNEYWLCDKCSLYKFTDSTKTKVVDFSSNLNGAVFDGEFLYYVCSNVIKKYNILTQQEVWTRALASSTPYLSLHGKYGQDETYVYVCDDHVLKRVRKSDGLVETCVNTNVNNDIFFVYKNYVYYQDYTTRTSIKSVDLSTFNTVEQACTLPNGNSQGTYISSVSIFKDKLYAILVSSGNSGPIFIFNIGNGILTHTKDNSFSGYTNGSGTKGISVNKYSAICFEGGYNWAKINTVNFFKDIYDWETLTNFSGIGNSEGYSSSFINHVDDEEFIYAQLNGGVYSIGVRKYKKTYKV